MSTKEWESARLSERHRAFGAAMALTRPSAVLCGVTALSMYTAPLMTWPREVHLRSRRTKDRGRRRTPYFPVQGLAPLKPAGMSRAEAQQGLESGELGIQAMKVNVPGVVFEDGSPVKVKVEPLPYVLVDTLPGLPRQEAIMVLDAVLAGRYGYGQSVQDTDLDAVEYVLKKQDAESWKRLRAFADPRSESPGESRCRVLIDDLGFAPPELQKDLDLPRVGRVRVDFWWEDVVCEFDGMVKYTRGFTTQAPEEVIQQEKLREDALRLLDYRVVRLTWDDLNHPDELGRKLLLAGVPHRALQQFRAAA
ncbi:hypothetical protein [Nesterenkonia ebinurensis]|uniref:hypothetical protein n=1 Tax=Nesterenkonia ebinurensis TaxID=2608252 RepID=UPI00123DFDB7|nr:hypothetical protein [Nesterenkonia ebinurensis]